MDDGTVIMHGRSKSVINVGGMKVFPEEIEAVLNTHPAIEKSRVFPERHPALGSYPGAEVIVRTGHKLPTLLELRGHCRDKLASYKIPMRLAAVNSIALTASGKVKRRLAHGEILHHCRDHRCRPGGLDDGLPSRAMRGVGRSSSMTTSGRSC